VWIYVDVRALRRFQVFSFPFFGVSVKNFITFLELRGNPLIFQAYFFLDQEELMFGVKLEIRC
jgi:hypothetical protein